MDQNSIDRGLVLPPLQSSISSSSMSNSKANISMDGAMNTFNTLVGNNNHNQNHSTADSTATGNNVSLDDVDVVVDVGSYDDAEADNIDDNEEEEEEDDDDDDDEEDDEDEDAEQYIPPFAPADEIVNDGTHQWLPIHLLNKNRSSCWTHFLGIDRSLHVAKCKHCGVIIEKSNNPNDRSSTKRFRAHLRVKHKIDPNSSYYGMGTKNINSSTGASNYQFNIPTPQIPQFVNKRFPTNSGTIIRNNNNSRVSKHTLVRPSLKNISPMKSNGNSSGISAVNLSNNNNNNSNNISKNVSDITISNDPESIRKAKERELSFPTNQLLSIIVASENLPLSFVDNTAVRLLISRVPKAYHVDQQTIKESISSTSYLIDEVVRRTVARNNADLPLIIDTSYLSKNPNERDSQLIRKLRLQLIEMGKTTFFSLSHYMWDEKFALLSLQFYDSINSCTKTIPLLVSALESEAISVTIRSQLNKVFANIPGLHKSVLSVTLPRSRLVNLLHLDDHEFFSGQRNPKNYYHNCILSILSSAILPLFGHYDENIKNDNEKMVERDILSQSPKVYSILDTLVNLSHVNISSSIFNKINSFYEELCTDPWQLDRFHSLCGTHLNDATLKVITFDPNVYSTAEDSLKRFLELRPVIEAIDPHIRNERFTEVDFQIMIYMIDTLESIDRLLLYFASSTSLNFTYVLISILAIEKHLSSTLSTLQFQRLIKPFEAVLKNVQDFKKVLITDDMNLLAMFLCPAALFEREILEYVFKTVSLSEIVDMISQTIFDLLKRFLDVHTVDSSQKSQPQSEDEPQEELQLQPQPQPQYQQEQAQEQEPQKHLQSQSQLQSESLQQQQQAHPQQAYSRSHSQSQSQPLLQSPSQQHSEFGGLSYSSLRDLHLLKGKDNSFATDVDTMLLNAIQEDLYEYLSTVNSVVPIAYRSYCDQNGFIRYNGRFKRRFPSASPNESDNNQLLNFIDELMDVHVPVCNAFWDQFLENGAGPIVKILIKIMRTQSASSVRSEYSFLKDFISRPGDDILEETVKIKLFNSQFVAGKVDFDMDTLPTACQYIT